VDRGRPGNGSPRRRPTSRETTRRRSNYRWLSWSERKRRGSTSRGARPRVER
jgi:hypothetical protein